MKRQIDVASLVFGLILTAIAGAALWRGFVGELDWALIKVAAPLGLVVIGVIGLALSRNRT